MLCGYRTTAHELRRLAVRNADPWTAWDVDAPTLPSWQFLRVDEIMRLPPEAPDVRRADLGRQLAMGSATRFRALRLDPILKSVACVAAAVTVVAIAVALRRGTTITVGPIRIGVAAAAFWVTLAIAVFAPPFRDWLRPHGTKRGVIYETVLAVGGFIAATLQLHLIDPCLRRRGKVRRLLRLEPTE
jgi:hypothetical protein